MQFERQVNEVGGSVQLIIPADLARFLDIKPGDALIIQDEAGKHGKYVSFWKKAIETPKKKGHGNWNE